MSRIRNRVLAALLIIASCLLPGAEVECDCEDGEFEFDFDGLCDDDDCDRGCCGGSFDGFFFDFWYDD